MTTDLGVRRDWLGVMYVVPDEVELVYLGGMLDAAGINIL